MTHEKWIKLTEDEKRIKVAELCGYERCENAGNAWWHPVSRTSRTVRGLPDYLNDLNAMHEAEKALDATEQCHLRSSVYLDCLADVTGTAHAGVQQELVMATARQRAEAFVLTMEPE